jgi:hypothetical protein
MPHWSARESELIARTPRWRTHTEARMAVFDFGAGFDTPTAATPPSAT